MLASPMEHSALYTGQAGIIRIAGFPFRSTPLL